LNPLVDHHLLLLRDSEDCHDLLGVLHSHGIKIEGAFDDFGFLRFRSVALLFLLIVTVEVLKGLINLSLLLLVFWLVIFLKRESDGLLDGVLLRHLRLLVHALAEHLDSLLDEVSEVLLVLLSLSAENLLSHLSDLLDWHGHVLLWFWGAVRVGGVRAGIAGVR